MGKTKILITAAILIVLVLASYFVFLKKEKPEYSLVKVARGDIVREVSETGKVKMGEKINLSFKNSGRIERIYVEVGDEVEAGKILAKLDASHLAIQLEEAQAALEVAKAKLNQLLAGSTPEEIQIARTNVANAQTALDYAKQNLEDVKASAKEDIDADYEDALNVLEDAYLKAYNAYNKADLIQRTYFSGNDQESIKVQENKTKIKNNLDKAKDYLDIAKNNSENEDIDAALIEFESYLDNIYDALTIIRDITETISYRNTVSSSDKTSLDTNKTNINTAFSNVVDSQQAIASTKLTNTTNINTAESNVSDAEGALNKAEDELDLKTAGPRQVDIDLHQAQIKQAEAEVNISNNQIQDASLKSPTNGQVTEISKRVGEIAQLADSVVSLNPIAPFQIKVDIYEEDVVIVDVGNHVEITLAAFPDEPFEGKVISIDPAEKLVDEIVYYEVVIDIDTSTSSVSILREVERVEDSSKKDIKPGMTADISIKVALRKNVLVIPRDATEKENGKITVQILKGEAVEVREIEIGMQGDDDMVEVLSGLVEGEEVIIH